MRFPFDGHGRIGGSRDRRPAGDDADGFRRDYLEEVEAFCDHYRRECFQAGIDYVPLDTSMQFDRALGEYLMREASGD